MKKEVNEMKKNDKTLKSIKEIRKLAKDNGVEKNALFETTLSRYETQINILEQLKETINASEVLVTKEYVKGRENYYTHPAITEYNRTTDSANKTASTLMKIIKSFNDTNNEEDDPLLNALNGNDANE